MLSYRHLFHAGNFSDVFKHALLARLLIALGAKEKPYFYLDTHAGTGRYDLGHEWAWKTREFETGIGKLWKRKDIPEALEPYLEAVRALYPKGRLRYYPGSPLIVMALRRSDDRVLLSELNKTDFAELGTLLDGERHVSVKLADGYEVLKSSLPPKERRGLVLLDSSFDRAGEFRRLVKALKGAYAIWPTGMYAIWYPLMQADAMRVFAQDVQKTGIRKILRLEMKVRKSAVDGMMPGCGMLVVNPPWKFDAEAKPLLDWLRRALAIEGPGHSSVDWLVEE